MLLDVLAEDLRAALIIALDDLEQAPLVMRLQVLVHDHRRALGVRAHDSPVDAAEAMLFELASP